MFSKYAFIKDNIVIAVAICNINTMESDIQLPTEFDGMVKLWEGEVEPNIGMTYNPLENIFE